MRITRIKAFAIHLGISVVIFLALLAVLVFDWYRFPLFSIDGGWKGIQIIAGVDLVLGPLLTLIVFKPGKPNLKFDLFVIACIQAVALIFGSWITYQQRPVLLVFAEERFHALSGDTALMAGVKSGDLRKFNNRPYPLAIVRLPDNDDERRTVRLRSLGSGGLYLRGDLYGAAENVQYLRDAQAHSVDMEKLVLAHPESTREIERFKSRHGAPDQFLFLPLHGRYGRALLALDRTSGIIIDKIDVEPPEQ